MLKIHQLTFKLNSLIRQSLEREIMGLFKRVSNQFKPLRNVQ